MSDRPEDVDAAFAEIVADLRREGVGVEPPEEDDAPEPPRADEPPPAGPAPQAWRGHGGDWDWSWGTDDEHYVPPEPPPLPRLRPLTIVALGLLIAGVLLLVGPSVLGLDARIATPIGLASLTCGGSMLLLRIRKTPQHGDPDDNGAQL